MDTLWPVCCAQGQVQVVKALLCANANPEHTTSSETALTWAVRSARVAVVEALILGGSRVGARNNRNLGALQLVSIGGAGCNGSSGDCAAIMRAILKAVDADCEQQTGRETDTWTALHYAARNSVVATETLLAAGCNANVRSPTGLTPLMRASALGSLEVVLALLRHPGVSIDAQTSGSNCAGKKQLRSTALLYACANGRGRIAVALLDAGADGALMGNGHNCLSRAAVNRSAATVKLVCSSHLALSCTSQDRYTAFLRAIKVSR